MPRSLRKKKKKKKEEGNPSSAVYMCVPVALLQHIRPRLTTFYMYHTTLSFYFFLLLCVREKIYIYLLTNSNFLYNIPFLF
jgi:hypothetical protein